MTGNRRESPATPVIGLYPFDAPQNSYIARNRELLESLGTVVALPRARRLIIDIIANLLRLRGMRFYDVLILNWPERLIIQRGNRLTRAGRFEYRVLMRLCRLAARQLVYVRHDRTSHGIPSDDRHRVAALIDNGQRLADSVVTLSPPYAQECGYDYVPHPLYAVEPPGVRDTRDEYVVFGRIRPYKQIDTLVAAWPPDASLVIVGPCDDEEYLDDLRRLARDKPVSIEVGYHDEASVSRRLGTSEGVIIVNDPASTIVSGTYFFAVSCGARVLALADPFFRWIETTPLGDGLVCFPSITALAAGIADDDADLAPGPREIRECANELFCDARVVAAWRDVLFQERSQTRSTGPLGRPRLSIITVAYNAERHLQSAIDSVAAQTYEDIEYIVVDGNSTDGTPAIIEKNAHHIDRWISEPDDGIADAMNKGLALATGDFVYFLHSDDYLESPDSIASASEYLDSSHDVFLFSIYLDRAGKKTRHKPRGFNAWLNFKTGIYHQATVCSKRLFGQIGGFDTDYRITMDYDFFLRAYRSGCRARVVDLPLATMRLVGVSSQDDWPSLQERFAEEQQAHARNTTSILMRGIYAAYWWLYLPYRRLRSRVQG